MIPEQIFNNIIAGFIVIAIFQIYINIKWRAILNWMARGQKVWAHCILTKFFVAGVNKKFRLQEYRATIYFWQIFATIVFFMILRLWESNDYRLEKYTQYTIDYQKEVDFHHQLKILGESGTPPEIFKSSLEKLLEEYGKKYGTDGEVEEIFDYAKSLHELQESLKEAIIAESRVRSGKYASCVLLVISGLFLPWMFFYWTPKRILCYNFCVLDEWYISRLLAICTKDEVREIAKLELNVSNEESLRVFLEKLSSLSNQYGFCLDHTLYLWLQHSNQRAQSEKASNAIQNTSD